MSYFMTVLLAIVFWEVLNHLVERIWLSLASHEALNTMFDSELRDLAAKYGFEVTEGDED